MQQKLRFNCKILLILLPFCLGALVYVSIAKNPVHDPDQLYKIKQSSVIPYYYISTYEDCALKLQFDNYTRSFELPKQYPFAKVRCSNDELRQYTYTLQDNTPLFTLNNQATQIVQIQYAAYYDEFVNVIFNLSGSTLYGYDERIQYSPAWFLRAGNHTFYAIVIYTSARVQTHYANKFLSVNVYGGQVPIYFFMDQDPELVIKAYHRFLGGYKLFPLKSFGYQYYGEWVDQNDLDFLNMKGIPIEVFWSENDSSLNVSTAKIVKPTVPLHSVDKKYLIKSENGQPYQGCINNQSVNYLDYNVKQSIHNGNVILKKFITCDGPIDQNAYHYSNKPVLLEKKITERYFHPLNSFAQQLQYSNSLVISEDVFFGSGQFSAQVFESDDLERSIAKLIYNNFFGVPYTGTYGCDQGNSQLRWCSRWLSIQAWMPIFVSRSTEKFIFADHPEYFNQVQNEVQMRLQLAKWMFTQFIKNYDPEIGSFTGTIIQPLWWYNITDTEAYKYESREFIFGHDFLIAPIIEDPLNDYQTEYRVYFPYGNYWMQTTQQVLLQGGTHVDFDISTSTSTPIFQRAGTIVCRQSQDGLNTTNNVYQLYAVFDRHDTQGFAEGEMITLSDLSEENVQKKCIQKNCLMKVRIRYEYNIVERYWLSVEKVSDETVFERVEIDAIHLFHSKLHFQQVINYKVIIDQDLIQEIY